MGGTSRYKKGASKLRAGWQVSVAEIMEDMGKFIPNEKLDPKHPKIKNPHLAKK